MPDDNPFPELEGSDPHIRDTATGMNGSYLEFYLQADESGYFFTRAADTYVDPEQLESRGIVQVRSEYRQETYLDLGRRVESLLQETIGEPDDILLDQEKKCCLFSYQNPPTDEQIAEVFNVV